MGEVGKLDIEDMVDEELLFVVSKVDNVGFPFLDKGKYLFDDFYDVFVKI